MIIKSKFDINEKVFSVVQLPTTSLILNLYIYIFNKQYLVYTMHVKKMTIVGNQIKFYIFYFTFLLNFN